MFVLFYIQISSIQQKKFNKEIITPQKILKSKVNMLKLAHKLRPTTYREAEYQAKKGRK